MSQFRIRGGRPLQGTIAVSGAKNAALKMIAASILATQPITLRNVPRIIDVQVMLEMVAEFGVTHQWLDEHTLSLDPINCQPANPTEGLAQKLRASFILVGPALGRFGKITVPFPGGDKIGLRPVDTHLQAFGQLGVDISQLGRRFQMHWPKRTDADVYLLEPSVTATENILLATVLGENKTTIYGAATEPEIGNLIDLLIKLGANIKGKDTSILEIIGQRILTGGEVEIIPDRIELGTILMASLITRGTVTISNAIAGQSNYLIARLQAMGVKLTIDGSGQRQTITAVRPTSGLKAVNVDTRPYPGFYTDLQSPMAALVTQATGRSIIFETMYEGRFAYVPELQKMGARIIIDGSNKIIIDGPTPLLGAHVVTNDIRAGAALVLAGLAATGETKIDNIELIDRGYETLDERLNNLGADIERVM